MKTGRKRPLYTYCVHVGDPGDADEHIVGWRKTAEQAGEFAASLVEMRPKYPDYPVVTIVRRERQPGDFGY